MRNKSSQVILTHGVDHIGLTVAELQSSVAFFVKCLGWHLLGSKPDYPAAFVGDGQTRVTLWQVSNKADLVTFNRHQNIGLHHLALKVLSLEDLHALHERVKVWPGVIVEFSPELSGAGPKIHSMILEPGGCRIEFAWDPRLTVTRWELNAQ